MWQVIAMQQSSWRDRARRFRNDSESWNSSRTNGRSSYGTSRRLDSSSVRLAEVGNRWCWRRQEGIVEWVFIAPFCIAIFSGILALFFIWMSWCIYSFSDSFLAKDDIHEVNSDDIYRILRHIYSLNVTHHVSSPSCFKWYIDTVADKAVWSKVHVNASLIWSTYHSSCLFLTLWMLIYINISKMLYTLTS